MTHHYSGCQAQGGSDLSPVGQQFSDLVLSMGLPGELVKLQRGPIRSFHSCRSGMGLRLHISDKL